MNNFFFIIYFKKNKIKYYKHRQTQHNFLRRKKNKDSFYYLFTINYISFLTLYIPNQRKLRNIELEK